ncbi:hypothetical protein GCM10020220_104310 [Nonomuraea rubra]
MTAYLRRRPPGSSRWRGVPPRTPHAADLDGAPASLSGTPADLAQPRDPLSLTTRSINPWSDIPPPKTKPWSDAAHPPAPAS